MIRGILIDPWNRLLTEVKVTDGLYGIYKHLSNDKHKVSLITTGGYLANEDTLYVDDEGLLSEDLPLFEFNGQGLAGLGLLLGSDADGNSVDAKSSLIEVYKCIEWSDMITTFDMGYHGSQKR